MHKIVMGLLAVILATPAWAGDSYVYLEAAQADSPNAAGALGAPCTVYSKTNGAGNGLPYTTQNCSTGQSMVYRFMIPHDFVSATTSRILTFAKPNSDATFGDTFCFNAAVTVFGLGSGNYDTTALTVPPATSTYAAPTSGVGVISSASPGSEVVPVKIAWSGADCTTACADRPAVMVVKRIACASGTDATGTMDVVSHAWYYQN